MPLGSPEDDIRWKDYEIDTPTFQLTPIEKPDMSPFLFHMTGKDCIRMILQSDKEGHGHLKANIPEATQDLRISNISLHQGYDARVVCFTESPTFALDFFRYRSFRRWDNDQRFGIGFDKSTLVNYGIRPVLYLDRNLLQNFIELYRNLDQSADCFDKIDEEIKNNVISSVRTIYPLLFPLMEQYEKQGFMWEREWRCTNPEGFYFSYNEIKVICCPENEEQDIRDCLGDSANTINFVRAWDEYDDVTDYLERQNNFWQQKQQKIQDANANQDLSAEYRNIKDIVRKYKINSHTLAQSQDFLKKLERWQQDIIEQKILIEEQINNQKNRLEEIEIQNFHTTIEKLEYLVENQLVSGPALGICEKCIAWKLDWQRMSIKQREIYQKYVLEKIDESDDIS